MSKKKKGRVNASEFAKQFKQLQLFDCLFLFQKN